MLDSCVMRAVQNRAFSRPQDFETQFGYNSAGNRPGALGRCLLYVGKPLHYTRLDELPTWVVR